MTNNLQPPSSSAAADQSESRSLCLFTSPLAARPFIPSVLYSSLFIHSLLRVMLFSQSPLSIKRSIDSPHSPRCYRSLFFHPAIFSALSLTSHFDFCLSDSLSLSSVTVCLLIAQYSCAVSHRERSMGSLIFHCSWALNSPYKYWHIFPEMQLRNVASCALF